MKIAKGKYEVLWYRNGSYELLGFEPSNMTLVELIGKVIKIAKEGGWIDEDITKIFDTIYLLPYSKLITVKDMKGFDEAMLVNDI